MQFPAGAGAGLADDHMTVSIELIESDSEGCAANKPFTQVDPDVSGDLVAVADEVGVPLELHQLVAGLSDVVDVEEIIFGMD